MQRVQSIRLAFPQSFIIRPMSEPFEFQEQSPLAEQPLLQGDDSGPIANFLRIQEKGTQK
jgi:hypothetical protein